VSTGKQLKLKLPRYEVFAGRGCSIPKRVFADIPLLSSTKLAACTFTTQESEGFNPVTYHAQHQDDSIAEFTANQLVTKSLVSLGVLLDHALKPSVRRL
jgi:hypothetical protein